MPSNSRPLPHEALSQQLRRADALVVVVTNTLAKFPKESLDAELRDWLGLRSQRTRLFTVAAGGPHGKLVVSPTHGGRHVVLPLEWLSLPHGALASQVRDLYWRRRANALSQEAARARTEMTELEKRSKSIAEDHRRLDSRCQWAVKAAGNARAKREAALSKKAASKARRAAPTPETPPTPRSQEAHHED